MSTLQVYLTVRYLPRHDVVLARDWLELTQACLDRHAVLDGGVTWVAANVA